MPGQITINNIQGVSPYTIWLCSGSTVPPNITDCILIADQNTVPPSPPPFPFVFSVPNEFSAITDLVLWVKDDENCDYYDLIVQQSTPTPTPTVTPTVTPTFENIDPITNCGCYSIDSSTPSGAYNLVYFTYFSCAVGQTITASTTNQIITVCSVTVPEILQGYNPSLITVSFIGPCVNNQCPPLPSPSNGPTPTITPTMTVTPSSTPDCSSFFADFTEQTNFQQCLDDLTIVVRYQHTSTNSPTCFGGHICNAAEYFVRINTIIVGTISLNNSGSTLDQYNYPPGETSGDNRYNVVTLTQPEIQDILAASNAGLITVAFLCATPPNEDRGWGLGACHVISLWAQVYLNNNLIYDFCPVNVNQTGDRVWSFTLDPCTGLSACPSPTDVIAANTLTTAPILSVAQVPYANNYIGAIVNTQSGLRPIFQLDNACGTPLLPRFCGGSNFTGQVPQLCRGDVTSVCGQYLSIPSDPVFFFSTTCSAIPTSGITFTVIPGGTFIANWDPGVGTIDCDLEIYLFTFSSAPDPLIYSNTQHYFGFPLTDTVTGLPPSPQLTTYRVIIRKHCAGGSYTQYISNFNMT